VPGCQHPLPVDQIGVGVDPERVANARRVGEREDEMWAAVEVLHSEEANIGRQVGIRVRRPLEPTRIRPRIHLPLASSAAFVALVERGDDLDARIVRESHPVRSDVCVRHIQRVAGAAIDYLMLPRALQLVHRLIRTPENIARPGDRKIEAERSNTFGLAWAPHRYL